MKLEDLDEELIEETEEMPKEEAETTLKDMLWWQKMLMFSILFVVAAVITTILWNLTPKERDEQAEESLVGELSAVQLPEPTQLPTTEPTVAPTPEPTKAPTPEPTVVPTVEPTSDATVEPTKEPATENGRDAMGFEETGDTVTPKDVINLRATPSTVDDNIVAQATNGEVLNRIGVNHDTGWSRIEYKDQVLYAVSQYLTTDLTYKTPVETSDPNRVNTIDGRVIVFADCDDWISPKEYVNLRTEPSTTEGNATVSCQLNYGEKVHRTGYSADSG